MANLITPNKYFYVRNHGGIPTIKEEDFVHEIGGLVGRPGTLTMAQLKDAALFPQIEMPITLQCCGTRRVEHIACYPTLGRVTSFFLLYGGSLLNRQLTDLKFLTAVGRGCHRDCTLEGCLFKEGPQVLRRCPCQLTHRGNRRRHLCVHGSSFI